MSDGYGRGSQLTEQLIVEELRLIRTRSQEQDSLPSPQDSAVTPVSASRSSIVSQAHNENVAKKIWPRPKVVIVLQKILFYWRNISTSLCKNGEQIP